MRVHRGKKKYGGHYEKQSIQRRTDRQDFTAAGEWVEGCRDLPPAWYQRIEVFPLEIEILRVGYNTQRPHRSLRKLTPFEYIEKSGNLNPRKGKELTFSLAW